MRSLRTMKAFRSSAAREHRAGDRVGAQRRAADRHGAQAPRLGRDQLARGAEGRRAQQGAARVDVVLGGAAAGERHLADHEPVLRASPSRSRLAGAHGVGLRRVARRRYPSPVPCPRSLNTLDPFNLKQQVARLDDVRVARRALHLQRRRRAHGAPRAAAAAARRPAGPGADEDLPAVQGAADPVAAQQEGRPAAVGRQRRVRRRLRRRARARGGGHRAAGDLGLLGLGAVGIDDGRRADRAGDGGPVAQLAARGLPRHPVDAAPALRAGRDARLHRPRQGRGDREAVRPPAVAHDARRDADPDLFRGLQHRPQPARDVRLQADAGPHDRGAGADRDRAADAGRVRARRGTPVRGRRRGGRVPGRAAARAREARPRRGRQHDPARAASRARTSRAGPSARWAS